MTVSKLSNVCLSKVIRMRVYNGIKFPALRPDIFKFSDPPPQKKNGSVVKMEYLVGDLNYTILDCNI